MISENDIRVGYEEDAYPLDYPISDTVRASGKRASLGSTAHDLHIGTQLLHAEYVAACVEACYTEVFDRMRRGVHC